MAAAFLTPADIANRACQHCGAQRIVDFNEDSVQASEISFNYDKVRRAELRRNVWLFAIRRAAIRPVTLGSTMLLTPAVWSSTTTYGVGAIVADSGGYLWQSRSQSNLANVPGNSAGWEAYCGPVSVDPYDTTGTTGYFAGELVYETPGDGTYAVYMSLSSGNAQDPRSPTLWLSTLQFIKSQIVLFYSAWASGTTYAAGNTIAYLGAAYVSLTAGNVGNTPSTSPTQWAIVSATIAPGYYSASTSYSLGQFVTYLGANYASRVNTNLGNTPSSSPTQWAAQAAGTFYSSLIDFNLNNDPSAAPALWAAGTTYAAGNTVGGSDGFIYSSIGSGNVGHDPTLTTGFWTNTAVLNPWTTVNPFGSAERTWVQLIGMALVDLIIPYPIQSPYPGMQSFARNVYLLPSNFLRSAPQDPKAGSVSFLGAPTGLMYNDWLFEGRYLVTRDSQPIALRFVADVTDVTTFDDMFCEGLGASIAQAVWKRLAGPAARFSDVVMAYNRIMSEARIVNGIETGPVQPAEDEYITCRI